MFSGSRFWVRIQGARFLLGINTTEKKGEVQVGQRKKPNCVADLTRLANLAGNLWSQFCLSECLDHQDGSPLYHQLAESLPAGFPRKGMTTGREALCNRGQPWKRWNLESVCWPHSPTARQQAPPWRSSWVVHLCICHSLCYQSRRLSVGWIH